MTQLPIVLPEGFTPKVSVSDKVTPETVIAEKKSGKTEIINLFSFGIPKNDLQKYLKKNIGDSINEGDVVAIKSGKLGVGAKKVISKFSGTITKIDEDSGEIYIRSGVDQSTENMFSPVVGIVDFCNNEKIVIKTDKETVIAKDSLGKKGEGEIYYIEDLDFNKLTSDISDNVVLVKKLDRTSLFKILGLGANGIITEEIDEVDFVDLNDKRIEIPILSISEEDFKKILKNKNKKVFLDGENKSIVIL
jgi:hypothetical protein